MESEGIRRIAAERERQITEEGWTPKHDDRYQDGVLSRAAAAYALYGHVSTPPQEWPWDEQWWKPGGDPIRTLEKAGALIAAEIDRLLRVRGVGDACERTA